MKVLAKVCGVMSPRDARIVDAAGADYMGVILSPGYSRSVERGRADEVYEASSARRVGVFVDGGPAHVAELAGELGLDVVQLSGSEPPWTVAEIAGRGRWRVWKTIHARSGLSIEGAARRYAEVADGILIDAWDPSRPGGTGRTFGWAGTGRTVRGAIGAATFIAAGGMAPENAAAAIGALSPDILDVSSGVESAPGSKDAERTRAFVEAVRNARPEARDRAARGRDFPPPGPSYPRGPVSGPSAGPVDRRSFGVGPPPVPEDRS